MSTRVSIAVWAALLGSGPVRASDDILVASSRSNSIEHFTASGPLTERSSLPGSFSALHPL